MTSKMTSKKNNLRKIIVRRLTVLWKLVIFWAVLREFHRKSSKM